MNMSEAAITQNQTIKNGEVHNSIAPLLISLAITLCLGGLLIWPLAILGIPLLVYSIYLWVG
ncbi:MAG TPA: hypothetical protein QGF70_00285, partial [Candidatus Thalassarchaeaceae archaeon]|nr:hypothetical protein [Candidatus Thalassarchaeaceae archaeon]